MKALAIALFRSRTEVLVWLQIPFTLVTLALMFMGFDWQWWTLSLGMYALIGCLGISICYHRHLTHGAFEFRRGLRWLIYPLTWLGALAGTGSSIGWVAVHRQHHKHADTEGDPHSPAVSGWKTLLTTYSFDWNKWAIRHLITDPFHRLLHEYYHLWLVLWMIGLYLINPMLVLFGFLVPATISIWVSTVSNYVNHRWGYRNFETRDHAKNLWINALFTFGEGWHNNHHARPRAWNFGHKWWEIDLGAQVIKLLKA